MRQNHRIFQEVHQIQRELWLKLPTSPMFLLCRAKQIEQLQQRLELLQEQILWLTRNRQSCLLPRDAALIELLDLLISDAKCFRLLAEEFLIDSEGSTSCLHSVLQTSIPQRLKLLNQILPPEAGSGGQSNQSQFHHVKTA